MVRSNYNNLLKVDPIETQGTRVTKVTKKDYGYRVQMFNTFITEYFIKLIINNNKSAKAHFLVRRNYAADIRYTLYYDMSGEQITPQQYRTESRIKLHHFDKSTLWNMDTGVLYDKETLKSVGHYNN